jgi:multicomponent Na+:H+ antiporter subunit A
LIAILVGFGVLGAVLLAFGERLGRSAFLVAVLAPAASTVWVGARLADVVDGGVVTEHVSWVGGLGLAVDLRLDGFSATMTLVISAIGVLVLAYAASYFDPGTAHLGRLAGLLVLFAGAMVGLVQSDHLLLLYTCWEITSITSYLLIGNDHTDADARAAALHALLVTSAGGLAMLGGFVLLGAEAGTYRFSELADGALPAGSAVTAGLVLVLLGAFTKSAQYPFHAWLPGAMAAPTPVSAYLHSATMVKAGVYLIARLAPIFAATVVWRPLVLGVGLVTLVAGGLRALRQHDLKLLLAFGTVSQLGLMVVLFGAGTPAATTAGWVLLVAHALFKAALFMVVGIIDHQTGTRDIRDIPALGPGWRWVEGTALVSAASMAGVPLAAGFIAKEAAYGAFSGMPFTGSGVVLTATVGGSMLTVAYGLRFYWGAFVEPRRRARVDDDPAVAPAGRLVVPAVVMALASVALGVVPQLADDLASAAVASIDAGAGPVHLVVWHGLNLALALSALTLAGGWLLFRWNRRAQSVLATGAAVPTGEAVYLFLLRMLAATSRRVTAVVQNGSLPVYSGVILATAAVLPAIALLASWDWPGWPALAAGGDVPVAGMLLVAAFGAATVRRRFSAAVFLGAAGYAMAGLFVVHGAPDLALTQVAVETLTTVAFVLVLRQLPDRFERQSSSGRRAVRLGVAGLVGATVFIFAIVAGGSRTAAPVSDELIARAEPDGHGRNVVNVILVDFRALDTFGEITVLAVASIGGVALARAGRRVAGSPQAPVSARTEGLNRIVFVDVSVRVIFHAVLMTSLWLLFAGHNAPGGGFVGGLLAGSAITLRYVAGGMKEVRGRSRFRPWTVLGAGLLVAAVTAAFPLLGGGDVLDVASTSVTVPLLGTARLSAALVFDTGVYLTVVGMVLMAFEAFGDEPAQARP